MRIGGKPAVNLLLTGHNHFDHSFDTATWAKLSGARVIGSPTTCLQVRAAKIPAQPLHGRARWREDRARARASTCMSSAGTTAAIPAQESARSTIRASSTRVPKADATGGLRAGVAEDFPNGGGNRAYLFTVDGPRGRFSWFFQDSASAVDLRAPDRRRRQELRRAARQSARGHARGRLDSVDLWIATGGVDVASARAAGAQAQRLSTRALGWLVRRVQGRPAAALRRCGARRRCSASADVRADQARAVHGQMAARSPTAFTPLDNAAVKAEAGLPLMRVAFLGTRKHGHGMAGAPAGGRAHRLRSTTARRRAPRRSQKLGARIADSPQRRRPERRHHHRHDGGRRIVARHVAGRNTARWPPKNAPDALAIECSTLSHDWVLELAAQVHERGFRYVDAPVTGLPDAAAAGTLTLLVGADAAESRRGAAHPHLARHARAALRRRSARAPCTN